MGNTLEDYYASNPDAELIRINQILQENSKKNFVDRIINKDKYPTLDLGNGQVATHKMAWAEVGGQYVVYPTVVYEGNGLVELDPNVALQRALQTQEFIPFNAPEDASWFSRNYKKVWESNKKEK